MTQEEQIYMLKKSIQELELEIADLAEKYDNSLKDSQNFIRCCEQRDELAQESEKGKLKWTQEQKDFLDEYLQFFND